LTGVSDGRRELFDAVVVVEGAVAGLLVVDNSVGVVFAEGDIVVAEGGFVGAPRCVEEIGREVGQFGDVISDVVAGRVVFFGLSDGIEHTEKRLSVGAATGGPLPSEGIVGEVGVDEEFPEVVGAPLPGDEKIFGEKRGDDHADAIVNPSVSVKLADAGVDDGKARFTTLPVAKVGCVVSPVERPEFVFEGSTRGLRIVVEEMVGKLTPHQFLEKSDGTGGVGVVGPELVRGQIECVDDGVPDLSGRELAGAQVRRESARAIGIRAFPGVVVVAQHSVDHALESVPAGCLRREPPAFIGVGIVVEAAKFGSRPTGLQRIGRGNVVEVGDADRFVDGDDFQEFFPEWCIDVIRAAGSGFDGVGIVHQRRVEFAEVEGGLVERAASLLMYALIDVRATRSIPVDAVGGRLSDDVAQQVTGVPFADQKVGAGLAEVIS